MNFLKSVEGKISPLAYQMTVPLGQSSFASSALRPLVDVSPFSVIGGHILLSSPSPHVKLIATSLANNSIQNAAIVDLTEINSNQSLRMPYPQLDHHYIKQVSVIQ